VKESNPSCYGQTLFPDFWVFRMHEEEFEKGRNPNEDLSSRKSIKMKVGESWNGSLIPHRIRNLFLYPGSPLSNISSFCYHPSATEFDPKSHTFFSLWNQYFSIHMCDLSCHTICIVPMGNCHFSFGQFLLSETEKFRKKD